MIENNVNFYSKKTREHIKTKNLFLTTALILGAVTLGSGLFGIAYAQEPPVDTASNVVGLLTQIGTGIAAMGAILTAVIGFLKNATGNKLISYEIQKKVEDIAKSMRETDDWIQEKTEEIKDVVEAVTKTSPEAKKFLDEKGVTITALTKDIEKVNAELTRIYEKLPKTNLPK
jgi:hypothetical protein